MNNYNFSLDKNVKIEVLEESPIGKDEALSTLRECYVCKRPHSAYYKVSWDDPGVHSMFPSLKGKNRCYICSEECANMFIFISL